MGVRRLVRPEVPEADLVAEILAEEATAMITNMKFVVAFFTALAVFMVGSRARAFDIPSKPDNGWYIRDTANKISTPDIQILNQKIENFNNF